MSTGAEAVRLREGKRLEVVCERCGRVFGYRYGGGHVRRVCDDCGYEKQRLARLRLGRMEARADELADVARLTRAQVASNLGISERAVATAERRALWKVRQHPELWRLWSDYLGERAAGMDHLRTDPGEQLMAWELAVAQWWELERRLREHGLTAEADECAEWIGRLQGMIGRAVGRS